MVQLIYYIYVRTRKSEHASGLTIFALDKFLYTNLAAVILDISEFGNPIAKDDATRSVGELYIGIAMAMTEYKAIDRSMLGKIFASIAHARLILDAAEGNIAIQLVLTHAVRSPTMTKAQRPTGMNKPRKKPLQQGAVENGTKNCKVRFIGKFIAMGKEELPAVYLGQLRLAMHYHATLLLEVVLAPKVVVAGEEMNLGTIVRELGNLTQETGKALGHHILVLVPKIEHIAKHINSRRIVLYFIKERHKASFVRATMLYSPRAQMGIGNEIYFILHGSSCAG